MHIKPKKYYTLSYVRNHLSTANWPFTVSRIQIYYRERSPKSSSEWRIVHASAYNSKLQ